MAQSGPFGPFWPLNPAVPKNVYVGALCRNAHLIINLFAIFGEFVRDFGWVLAILFVKLRAFQKKFQRIFISSMFWDGGCRGHQNCEQIFCEQTGVLFCFCAQARTKPFFFTTRFGISLAIYRGHKGLSLENSKKSLKGVPGASRPRGQHARKHVENESKTSPKPANNLKNSLAIPAAISRSAFRARAWKCPPECFLGNFGHLPRSAPKSAFWRF